MSLIKSIKKAVKTVAPVAGAAIGAYFGGPAGMAAGSSLGGAVAGSDGDTSSGFDWSSLVNGAVGLGQDYLSSQMDLGVRKQAADYAYKKNLQMWNLQNAYNDPSAQMERLKAAGLNPNLVYGGGNVTGNAASSGPEYSLDGNVFKDRSVQREQLQLALAEHYQRVTNQSIENDLARQRLVLQERDADRSDALAQAQIQAMRANMGVYDANINNMAFNQNQDIRKFAFERYKADLASYERFVSDFRRDHKSWSRVEAERAIQKSYGRRPMLMDYLPGGIKYKNY